MIKIWPNFLISGLHKLRVDRRVQNKHADNLTKLSVNTAIDYWLCFSCFMSTYFSTFHSKNFTFYLILFASRSIFHNPQLTLHVFYYYSTFLPMGSLNIFSENIWNYWLLFSPILLNVVHQLSIKRCFRFFSLFIVICLLPTQAFITHP